MKKRLLCLFLSLALLFSFPVSAAMKPNGKITQHGIDISKWNPVTSWAKVEKNVDFTVIRATHALYLDPKLASYTANAQFHNIPHGFYTFFCPSNSDTTVRKMADFFWNSIKSYPYQIYPVLDIETVRLYENDKTYASKSRMLACVKLFLSEFKKVSSGREIMIYASPSFVNSYLDSSFSKYLYWEAHYTTASSPMTAKPWNKTGYVMWQYTSSGSVGGISGRVDRDRATEKIYVYKTVQSGSRGSIVKQLQSKLMALRYTLKADGIFGSKTKAAVKAFQKRNGLSINGIAGIKTWTMLTGGLAVKNAATYATIRYGSRGSTVKTLQKALGKKGYKLTADGIFGKKTFSAVKSFQRKHGLKTDGICGPKTWKALGV